MIKYIKWDEIIYAEICNERIYLYVDRFEGRFEQYIINDAALEVIEAIDGSRTIDEVYELFVKKYNDSLDSVKENVDEFICELEKNYGIHIKYINVPENCKVDVKKVNIYPKVVSIELTDFCNLKCKHCYGAFDRECKNHIPLEKVKNLLRELNECKTIMVELTGGECLTHPYFKEILEYALTMSFKQIAILSNGVGFTDEIFDIIEKNKNKISLQIDMHSLNEDYLDWFVGRKEVIKIIEKNIKRAISTGAPVRVVSVLTKGNLNELEQLAAWANDIGATSYAISTVISLGRAMDFEELLLLDEQEQEDMVNRLKALSKKYPEMMKRPLVESFGDEMINCGCISSHLTINSKGDVKMCTMDCGECTKSVFGNALEEGVINIYDKHQELIRAISNLYVPNAKSNECKKCENYAFCVSCMMRTFLKARDNKEKCHWYKTINDKIIKEAFFGE